MLELSTYPIHRGYKWCVEKLPSGISIVFICRNDYAWIAIARSTKGVTLETWSGVRIDADYRVFNSEQVLEAVCAFEELRKKYGGG